MDWQDEANDILNRMKKAFETGKAMRISHYELQILSLTILGSIWDEDDPRIDNFPHSPESKPVQPEYTERKEGE